MSTLLWLLTLGFVFVLGFGLTHQKQLTSNEVTQLAEKRRLPKLRAYFLFHQLTYSVNPEFKRSMKSDGQFYDISVPLPQFPSFSAALLKGKKHEWIVIGFERHERIFRMWANKGPDRVSVSAFLDNERVSNLAKSHGATSVLVIHNHPHVGPSNTHSMIASGQDVKSAQSLAGVLQTNGLSLVEFIAERGRFMEYARF